MKKKINHLVVLLIVGLLSFGMASCAEGALGTGKNHMSTAVGVGYNSGVVEAAVIIDGYNNPIKVSIDEIFGFKDVVSFVTGFTLTDSDKVKIGTKEYIKYVQIGNEYFEADTGTANKYKQISGDKKITDLGEYMEKQDGAKWYYDMFLKGQLFVCKVDSEGTQVGEVKLSSAGAFKTNNGSSLRKKLSTYWSSNGFLGGSQLGFKGNMEALENYLIAYGFDGSDKVTDPNKNDDKYFVEINGITTGATLSNNTANYVSVAKTAYDDCVSKNK